MARRWIALVNGLLVGSMLAATASGQTAGERTSFSERMATLRRGWFQNEDEQADADKAPAAAPSTSNTTPRVAAQPRAGSVPVSPSTPPAAQGATLPGLGGAPLPQRQWSAPQTATAGPAGSSQEVISDYPVIRDVTAESQQSATAASGGAQPQRTFPTATPANATPARRSPGLRPTPHLDPEELRRELAGAFPAPEKREEPTPRIARADDRAATAFAPEVEPEETATSAQPDAEATDMPLSLPAAEPTPYAGYGNPQPTPKVIPAEPQQITPRIIASPQPAAPADDGATRRAAEAFGLSPAPEASTDLGESNVIRSPRFTPELTPQPASPRVERRPESFGEALQSAGGGDPSVLVANQTPVITADIRGPKQILMGREAVYRVRMQNLGATGAEGVVASIRIPPWADIVDTNATQGTVQPSQNAATPTQLDWQLARLEGRATETLDIRLVPRASRPLELGISWTIAPVGSRAIVEVQEPKLNIDIAGPNEVLFDKPQVFRLTLSNPGTGPAENVKIELVPPGGAPQAATSHTIGNLLPGESKSVEIELTARESGKLTMKASASAEGGLATDVAKEIFCRKPELELDWRGPATKYAGTVATYYFRVRNPGTAPAEDVQVQAALPEGAEFTSASEGQVFDAQRRSITWRVGTLGPGDDKYMELKCVVKKPGLNQMRITAATAGGNLTDTELAQTKVEALADLKLDVVDPTGPVAVGSPAVYEIRVANRGAISAKEVNVVGLFSDGIEPEHAEGAMYTMTDGRVSFRTIEDLPPGRELTLRIRARAVQPGTHVFRAEVLCRDADIKLATEQTTRFYTDEVLPDEGEPQQSAGRNAFETSRR